MSNDLMPVEPPPVVRRWVWEDFIVLAVYEHEETLGGYKDKATGQDMVIKEKRGWFVRVSGSSALYVGEEKPALAPGDKVRFTMEKVSP